MAEIHACASTIDSALSAATLKDKYELDKDRVLMTGTQAVVRMLLMQKEMDRRTGLRTAGFVTGYRWVMLFSTAVVLVGLVAAWLGTSGDPGAT